MAVPVTLFADFTSAASYVTEAALWRLVDEGLVTPEFRALEIFPAPARLPLEPPTVDEVRPLADELGVELRRPPLAARTRKAHELARFGAAKGMERELRAAIHAAYFRDGRDIGRIDVLVEIASALGLDTTESKVVLDIDSYAAAVAADAADARRVGIAAVPVMVVGAGGRIVAGPQPLDLLRAALAGAG
ncbi:MAG TPA: DsbA family protein [Longimicrobium sp.]|nr:DsbA family protein [Longimicrobium sp.]